MIFPFAYLALTSALTVLLLAVGLAGRAEFAAELAVVQGALLATFYAFSANTRSLILQGHGDLTPDRLLAKRVVVLPLLCVAAYLLCVQAAGVSAALAALVIARRACEWLAEIRLCELEVAGQRRHAARALAVQLIVTAIVAVFVSVVPDATMPALVLFALAPLLASAPRLRLAEFRPALLRRTLLNASPYIGSTAIEGISTYVLRLVVFLVAGPYMSGLLFTAFVLGSFAATLFANVLGPTLALSKTRSGGARRGRMVAAATLAMAFAGIAISAGAFAGGLTQWLGRPGYFWLALGLSLLGGAIMIGAQLIRLRLFDDRRGEVLFGPDVLRNIATIIAAPSLYYLLSPSAMAALYLLTALLTLIVYWGAARAAAQEEQHQPSPVLGALIAGAILLPLFFMLDGRVYHSPHAALLETGGGVMNVPLPLSLAACFAGLVLLGLYRQAGLALATVFFLFVAMVLTSVVGVGDQIRDELRKLVLLFQFLVPAFALVLGQMYGAWSQGLRAASVGFAVVLALLVPAQLVRSIGYGDNQLFHDLGFFSIYQHLQYVPAVIVVAHLVALFALWNERWPRRLLVALAPLVAYYAASAYSTLAVLLAGVGALVVVALRWREPAARVCVVLVVATLAGYFYVNRNAAPVQEKFGRSPSATEWRLAQKDAAVPRPVAEALPGPVQMRLYYWKLYANGIAESAGTALFGHRQVMDRNVAPSAHNYYLDFVYNFGVVAFLPLAALIAYTLVLLWRCRREVWREFSLLGLAIGVLFALALDNMFKVPMRQPYSGIFFFFLWGLLIARLRLAR